MTFCAPPRQIFAPLSRHCRFQTPPPRHITPTLPLPD
jgi:hypothetical protein